jgi:hypothetical protein
MKGLSYDCPNKTDDFTYLANLLKITLYTSSLIASLFIRTASDVVTCESKRDKSFEKIKATFSVL